MKARITPQKTDKIQGKKAALRKIKKMSKKSSTNKRRNSKIKRRSSETFKIKLKILLAKSKEK